LSGTVDGGLGIGANGSAKSARGAAVGAIGQEKSVIATLWQQEAQSPHSCEASFNTSDP
jgi:hypothetical protein